HQGGAVFNPVAVVAVQHTVDGADFRLVNVAADDPVQTQAQGFPSSGGFKGADGGAGIFNPILDPVCQRPVGQSQRAAQAVAPAVEEQKLLITKLARQILEWAAA